MLPTLLAWSLAVTPAAEPKAEPLWPNGAPGAVAQDEDRPNLTAFLPAPENATGTAVVVCPGGGYAGLADGHEGRDVAKWLNDRGVAAFMLRYRIAKGGRPTPLHPLPLQDAQRAIRTVRSRAKEYGIDPKRIGIWGFSAGGHLASTAATHFDSGRPDAADPVERASCRPDFVILAYPVVSMESPPTHAGSRRNLIGANPDPKLLEELSNEKHVTKETPPTFIFQTDDDKAVPAENCVQFYLALRKAGVPAELHVYAHGRHGVGLAPTDPVLSSWPDRLAAWMKGLGLVGVLAK